MENGKSDIFEALPIDINFQKDLNRKSKRAVVFFNVVALMFLAATAIVIIAIGPNDNFPMLLGQSVIFIFLLIGIIQFIRYKKYGWYCLFFF